LLQICYPFLRKLSVSTQQITTYINLKISFSQTLNRLRNRFYLCSVYQTKSLTTIKRYLDKQQNLEINKISR